ncbi:MAG: response regulator transcription factor [Firmicutes bacterium]|jgi:DNA-binding NarL/FixJ family response regulator|nr:response regulator transcription factor [Bacillota bacterium]MDD4335881.1 response regulator transcription factor [Bacillota bacterium]MDD4792217.1 response regulator transcription factor [Bacillota bacterium]
MRVLIVDDDPLICQSLKAIMQTDDDVEVVGMGHDGHRAVELFTQLEPDVLLMDIRMEKMTGLEACERILDQFPNARVLFLTTFSDDEYIVQALQLGAKGYILKQDFESIIPALKAVYMGQSVFGDAIVTKLPKLLTGGDRVNLAELGINEREQNIIDLVAKGLSNREIAAALYLSEGTVRNYLSVILEKLELRDRTQLAVFYLKRA